MYVEVDSVGSSGLSSFLDESTYFRLDPSINPSNITTDNNIVWNSEDSMLIDNNDKSELNESLDDESDPSKRTGSVFSAISNIGNGVVGAGILSFPYAMYTLGVVSGVFGIVCITMLIFATLYVNIRCSFTKVGGHPTYHSMIKTHLGPVFMKLNEVAQFVAVFGSCVAYCSIFGDYTQSFLIAIFGSSVTDNFYGDKKVVILFVTCLIVYPLCLLRKTQSLRFTSSLAVITSAYLSIFIVVTGLIRIFSGESVFSRDKKLMNTAQWVIQTKRYQTANFPIFFLGLPINLFGLTCHSMMFPVSYEMKNASPRQIWKAVFPAFGIILMIYLLVECMGFFQFGNNVSPNILDNFSSGNIFASIGRFLIGVNVMFTYPLLAFVGRLVMTSLIFFFFPAYKRSREKDNGELGTFLHVLTATFYVAASVFLALFVPGIDVAFGLTGSIGCGSTVFLFPSILCFYQIALKSYSWENPCRYFHILLSILLFASYLFFVITGCLASVLKVVTK